MKNASRKTRYTETTDEIENGESTTASNIVVLNVSPEQLNSLLFNLKSSGAHLTKSPGDVPAVIAFQSYGVTCDGKYNAENETLTVTIVSKPFFLTFAEITAGLTEALEL